MARVLVCLKSRGQLLERFMRFFSPLRVGCCVLGFALWLALGQLLLSQKERVGTLSGVVITHKNEVVEGVSLTILYPSGHREIKSEPDGTFRCQIPHETVTLKIGGRYIVPQE